MGRLSNIFLKTKSKDYRKTLKAISSGIVRIRNLNKLLNVIVRFVRKSAGLSCVYLFLRDENLNSFILGAQMPKSIFASNKRFAFDEPLVKWLLKEKNPLLYEEFQKYLRHQKKTSKSKDQHRYLLSIRRAFEGLNASLCVPGFIEEKPYCILILGKKTSGKRFNQDDIDTFITLTNQAALAIENAKAYEELKNTKDQLSSTQQLITVGRLAAGLAHEIKNPLTAIKTFAQTLPEKYNDPSFREKFARIVPSEVDRIDRIIGQLLDFAQPRQPNFQTIRIHNVIDSALELLEKELLTKDMALKKDYISQDLELKADRDQLKQVFLNLILNSLDAMERGGKLKITTQKTSKDFIIKIIDTGKGIPKEHIQHLFDPFFTTKERGTGLGLNIVKRIIESHKGNIEVESQPGTGTVFTIKLPLP